MAINERAAAGGLVRTTACKVPQLTVLFWITKALTTAMGESTSDYLVHRMNPELAVVLGFLAFVVALALQLAVRRYYPWAYWFAVAMVGVFGTMAADVLHVGLGVPYAVSTALYAATLAAVFVAWYACEKTLSVHEITTRRRELFYWAAVMATFALGTAAGDFSAVTLHLGYLSAGLMFGGLILVPAIAYRLGLNGVLAFWSAYVLTRPLGASFADWTSVSHVRGGLAFGAGRVSLVLAVLIAGCVWYLATARADVPEPAPAT